MPSVRVLPSSSSSPTPFTPIPSFILSLPLSITPVSSFSPKCHPKSPVFRSPNRPTRPNTPPSMSTSDSDLTSQRVRNELAADGINLDELLNASKVIDLTCKLEQLSLQLARAPEGSEQFSELSAMVSKVESDLVREKRQVMQKWLKNLFLAQAFLFIAIGGVLSNNLGFDVPLVGRALGFWMIWLFTIPALRARKGTSKTEKSALNVAFVATPLLNVALPALTKNTGLIWSADVLLLVACYLYYGIKAVNETEENGTGDMKKEEGRVKGILRYLDWGSWR